MTLVKKYKAAVSLRNVQVEAHRGFSGTISEEQLREWETMCQAWYEEPYPKEQSENPFRVEGAGLSKPQARKELADEEESRLKAGGVAHHSMSRPECLGLGLELEEEQRRLKKIAKKVASAARAAKLALAGPGGWEKEFQLLQPQDIRSYTGPEQMKQGPGCHGTAKDNAEPSTDLGALMPALNDEMNLLPEA
ncbi:hypothetical protein DXG01_006739 [Tephrocybe rancida]|nr:hypothetical protein DXG01_006739 [Tephrocybe rancida]